MRSRVVLPVAMVLGLTATLSAHDLFIKLSSYFVEPNTLVQIPVLNGTFAVSENSITRDRVVDISVVSRGGWQHVDTTAWVAEGDTTVLTIRTGEPGTYLVGASTHPRELEMAGADFNAYLEHDGIPDVLEARRTNNELDVDVRERYAKHVKAVIQVGDSRDAPRRWWQFWREKSPPSYTTPLGYPAELVPLDNPYSLGVGDEIRVRCLVDWNPVANQLVIAGGDGIEERSARSDADGIAAFQLDTAGTWYIKFINMVPVAGEELDYESKWATLTFAVR